MAKGRRTLPLLDAVKVRGDVAPPRPRIEQARRALGGEAASCASAGEVVEVEVAPGVVRVGVVLHASDGVVDVWFGDSAVRRTSAERVTESTTEAAALPDSVLRASSDARVFGSLRRGERVLFQAAEGATEEGTLIERCRFGGVVARDDGTLLAVGFRRLRPTRQG